MVLIDPICADAPMLLSDWVGHRVPDLGCTGGERRLIRQIRVLCPETRDRTLLLVGPSSAKVKHMRGDITDKLALTSDIVLDERPMMREKLEIQRRDPPAASQSQLVATSMVRWRRAKAK
jgi:hypothetical protein